jgi:hypothetical protein
VPRLPLLAAAAALAAAVAVALAVQSAPARAGRPVAAASAEIDSGPAANLSARSKVPVGGHPAGIVPFTPSPQLRGPTRADHLPPFWADGRGCSAGCYPGARKGWPLKPFHAQHAIRAGLNELRTGSMHIGIDIQAYNGQAVYALQGGSARVLQPTGIDSRVRVGRFIYWHVIPSVSNGQHVSAYSTVVGHVLTPAGHLHLSEVLGGDENYINPLRPGGRVLAPYRDLAPPVIGAPSVHGDGRVDIHAYDPQSFVVRTTYPTPVLAPAALAYRLYDLRGHAVTSLEWALRGTHVYSFSLAHAVYAGGARGGGWLCFGYHPRCTPNWHYWLAGGLAPRLPHLNGRYRLTTYAWDWVGNVTARDDVVALG